MSVVSQQHLFSSSAMMISDDGGSVQFDGTDDHLNITGQVILLLELVILR